MDEARRKVAEALLGSGLVQRASQQIKNDPQYKMYVVEAQTRGIAPLPSADPNWPAHLQRMIRGE